jgi:tetratricopeptide (TPR) repeat protein
MTAKRKSRAFGYPEAALADIDQALKHAREIGQAATLMYALTVSLLTVIHCGNYSAATTQFEEHIALTDEKGTLFWKALAMVPQGCALALTGKTSDAIHMITSGVTALRSTGSALWLPLCFSYLARAYAELGQFDDAWCLALHWRRDDDGGNNQGTWCEADIHRIAGEIALLSPERDAAKAEAYFERALAVAWKQQAKSWELRAAMGLAHLWRDQGKRDEARELLAPVYAWFTEGFDTLDLRKTKALLDELAS